MDKATYIVLGALILNFLGEYMAAPKDKLNSKTLDKKHPVTTATPMVKSPLVLGPSGHEMDVDDRRDLLVHERRELETQEPCGKDGTCGRVKRQVFKLLDVVSGARSDDTNQVYDTRRIDGIGSDSDEAPKPKSVFDDDDGDENGHMVILNMRKRRRSDHLTEDDESSEDDTSSTSDDRLSGIISPPNLKYRSKRDVMSDFKDIDDFDLSSEEDNSESDLDDEVLISDDDDDDELSLSLSDERTKRETSADNSSLDTFEEENDEIYDDVLDNETSDADSSSVKTNTPEEKTKDGVTNKNPVLLDLSNLEMKNEESQSHYPTGTKLTSASTVESDKSDDTSFNDAKNSGPETDTEVPDIPFDEESADDVLTRIPRESEVAFEEGVDPNSGYLEWGSWAPCSVTCGIGQSERRRICVNPAHCKAGDVEITACSPTGDLECKRDGS